MRRIVPTARCSAEFENGFPAVGRGSRGRARANVVVIWPRPDSELVVCRYRRARALWREERRRTSSASTALTSNGRNQTTSRPAGSTVRNENFGWRAPAPPQPVQRPTCTTRAAVDVANKLLLHAAEPAARPLSSQGSCVAHWLNRLSDRPRCRKLLAENCGRGVERLHPQR